MAELLAVLYRKILRVSPATVDDPDRDRFILSKGHSLRRGLRGAGRVRLLSPGLAGELLPERRPPGRTHHRAGIPGVEVSTGALGHGLPIACGLALAARRDRRPYRVFVLLSDGECDEGSTWEAVLFAGHHGLENLVAIVDYNKIQSLGRCKDVLDLDPFAAKWSAFGWAAREIDGHDVAAIEAALATVPLQAGKPTCVIAHTVKGKGVSFMEDKLLWHYRTPQGDEYQRAIAEIEAAP